jgi:alanyl-tRNA synthetase
MVVQKIAGLEANLLRQTVDKMKEQVSDKGVFVLAAQNTGNIAIVCACTSDLVKAGFDSGALLKRIALLVGGSGGGRKDFAQGGTKDILSLNNSWAVIQEMVRKEIDNIGDIS